MTDQPRDLAAELQQIISADAQFSDTEIEAAITSRLLRQRRTLLLQIAALSRELDAIKHEACAQAQCIERLEGALREASRWLTPHEDSPPDMDRLHARIVTLLAAADGQALAASQQHTAGSGDALRARIGTGGQERCSDCPPANYPTDNTRCALCDRRTKPASIPGIDQGQFLAACGGGNAAFGERNSGGTPE